MSNETKTKADRPQEERQERRLLQGNEAIALAARAAGLRFYAGYPITPASEVMQYLSGTEVHVVQMEDEIASVHAAVGASLAGAKSMTATSGPGFSLMQEGVGMAHMMEVPLTLVNVQRVGPSTGMPTLAAQGDVLQSVYGSHGDYFPIVFYPNSVDELYRYTAEAMNAAEESTSCVVLLSDAYISHLYESVKLTDVPVVDRKLEPLGGQRRHFTGLTQEGGVPRTTDPEVHESVIERLRTKQRKVAARHAAFEYIDNDRATTLVVAYGFVSRAVYHFRRKFSIFRPIRMWPPLAKLKSVAEEYDRVVVVEANCGQYALIVEQQLKREVQRVPVLGGKIDLDKLGRKLR